MTWDDSHILLRTMPVQEPDDYPLARQIMEEIIEEDLEPDSIMFADDGEGYKAKIIKEANYKEKS